MQLFDSTSSPFVRKVNIVIRELGLEGRVDRLSQDAHPVRRDDNLVRFKQQRSALADWFARMSMHPSVQATQPRPRT